MHGKIKILSVKYIMYKKQILYDSVRCARYCARKLQSMQI